MWLAPGERWLFYEDVGYRLGLLEGEVAIQAVMSSQGHCHDQQIGGRRSFPLEPLFIETVTRGVRSLPVYRCWEGEARSSVWPLSVKAPTSPIDLEAREYLLQNRSLSLNQETGRWYLMSAGYRIRDKFPSSHYTYAFLARIGSNVHEKQLAVDLQQDNTLNPWVVGAIARHYLDHRSSCWKGESLGLDYSIEDLALPAGVGEYLAQYRWQLENRHCPPVVSNGNGGRNGVVHPTATSGLTVPDSVSTVLFSMNQPNRTLDETQARSNSPQRVAGARLVARDFRTPVSSRNLGSFPSRSALMPELSRDQNSSVLGLVAVLVLVLVVLLIRMAGAP
jgi:hypothetical protein